MGMYTEFHLNVELKQNLPQEVIDVLNYMTKENNLGTEKPNTIPVHPLFMTDRWSSMLLMSSAYFPVIPDSDFIAARGYGNTVLSIRTNFKNYDGEIKKFINWISPYIDGNELFLGYYRYEEDDLPTLIFRTKDGKIVYSQLNHINHTEHI